MSIVYTGEKTSEVAFIFKFQILFIQSIKSGSFESIPGAKYLVYEEIIKIIQKIASHFFKSSYLLLAMDFLKVELSIARKWIYQSRVIYRSQWIS